MEKNGREFTEKFPINKMSTLNVLNWTEDDVIQWLKCEQIDESITMRCIREQRLDGKSLLAVTETDIRDLKIKYKWLRLGDLKHFWIAIRLLQKENHVNLVNLGLVESNFVAATSTGGYSNPSHHSHSSPTLHHHCSCCSDISGMHDMDRISPPLSIDGRATSIQPEIFKTIISLGNSQLHTTSLKYFQCVHLFMHFRDLYIWSMPNYTITFNTIFSFSCYFKRKFNNTKTRKLSTDVKTKKKQKTPKNQVF